MKKVVIAGGAGLIGRELYRKLADLGYFAAILTRSKKDMGDMNSYLWDVDKQYIDPDAFAATDYIIHLAGENIGERRWTEKRKKLILESRTQPGQLLLEKAKHYQADIKAFISASAIGYYGAVTSERIFEEEDPPAGDFLGKTCREWEQSAEGFSISGIRTVIVRTGVVLTRKGGVLNAMMPAARLGLAVAIGKGNQYIPWIHIEDLCNIYLKAIEDNHMKGTFNAVAPEHITNKNFGKEIAWACSRHEIPIRLPAQVFKILYGEMASMLLYGSRVSSSKIIDSGYTFKFPRIEEALSDICT
jgi:uncharacterized protein